MTIPTEHYRVIVFAGTVPISEMYFTDKEESLLGFLSYGQMFWAEHNEQIKNLTMEQLQAGTVDEDNAVMALGTDSYSITWVKCVENELFPFSLN